MLCRLQPNDKLKMGGNINFFNFYLLTVTTRLQLSVALMRYYARLMVFCSRATTKLLNRLTGPFLSKNSLSHLLFTTS